MPTKAARALLPRDLDAQISWNSCTQGKAEAAVFRAGDVVRIRGLMLFTLLTAVSMDLVDGEQCPVQRDQQGNTDDSESQRCPKVLQHVAEYTSAKLLPCSRIQNPLTIES